MNQMLDFIFIFLGKVAVCLLVLAAMLAVLFCCVALVIGSIVMHYAFTSPPRPHARVAQNTLER